MTEKKDIYCLGHTNDLYKVKLSPKDQEGIKVFQKEYALGMYSLNKKGVIILGTQKSNEELVKLQEKIYPKIEFIQKKHPRQDPIGYNDRVKNGLQSEIVVYNKNYYLKFNDGSLYPIKK